MPSNRKYLCLKILSTRMGMIIAFISTKINFTYRYILESILYHFAPDDLYRIKRFPGKKYNLYLERLRFAVDSYFPGNIIDESTFGNEIKNPNP